MCHMYGACRKLRGQDSWITIGQKYSLAILLSSDWNSWLIPVASDSSVHPVLLKNDFSYSFLYPTINILIPRNVEIFQREFWEINPREQQDWFIHNFIRLILQIPLLLPSPLSYPWEDLKPNPYLTIFISMRRFLVFRKQFKREPIHFGWCNGLIAGSDKLEKIRLGVTLLEQEAWSA